MTSLRSTIATTLAFSYAAVALLVGDVASARPGRALPGAGQTLSTAPPRADSILGVFEGRTPCSAIALEFTGFPSRGCEKIKWRLTLYRDAATGQPTTYWYDGTRSERRGRWSIEAGEGTRRHAVYHLHHGNGRGRLSLLSLDDRVLVLLDRDLEVLVGDASWSNVLNRVSPRPGGAR